MDKLADLLRQGADKLVNLPTEAQRFVTNPQAFIQLLTGKNALPRETGFAAGATGLPAQQGTVLDPNYQAYMQGYEQGEPVSYAAMATPAVVPVAKALAPKAGQMAENYMVNQGFMPSIVAYHGTPHTIKGKFDISKVGTGEGAQAYGHGMYFAENPAVAKEYQKSLSGRTDFNQQPSDSAFIHAVESFRQAGTPLNAIPAEMKKAYKSVTDKDIQLAIQATEKGNLYKVDIPDADIPMMLDWGKPLAQQTPEVQAAIQKLGDRFRPLDDMEAKNVTGERLYRRIENSFGKYYGNQANPDASALLNSVGIKGIRYLDEGSRRQPYSVVISSKKGPYAESEFLTKEQAEQYIKEKQAEGFKTELKETGTSNFVVFEPSNVKILEQNSKPMSRKEILEQELKKVVE
jgi:hypothetical protein